MLEKLIDAVIGALEGKGIAAFAAYPPRPVESGGSFICLSLRSAAAAESGFQGYMGSRTDENGRVTEIYGMKCIVELGLDIYAPKGSENAALACTAAFGSAAEALQSLRPGLKISGISCGEPQPDRASGLFRCKGGLKCLAFLTAETAPEEAVEFSDFILRGELRK